jgi:DNA repair exonuclease SbcCD ATPase subunit
MIKMSGKLRKTGKYPDCSVTFFPCIRYYIIEWYSSQIADKRWDVAKYSDISIVCSQCGKKFVFSEDEQEFYKTKGYSAPLRCKQCRSARQPSGSVCTGCGNKLVEGSPLYCAACNIDVHLEFEQKAQALKGLLHESELKLQAVEAEKARIQADTALMVKSMEDEKNRLLEETRLQIAAADAKKASLVDLLMQKEQTVSGLEQRLDMVIAKMQKLPENIESLQLSGQLINSLNAKIEGLEKNQNSLKELLLQLIENRDGNHRDPNLMDSLKTFFRSDHRSPA